MIAIPGDDEHEWDSTGRCRLCGEGLIRAGVVCVGYAGEPPDADAALAATLAAIAKAENEA